MALVGLTGFAQQTGDYIYVYQKDGEILSFLRDEILEMGYSRDDTLGVTHDDVVSQIIVLEDVAYIIPLDDIDSISFVTPPTVYQPGVVRLEQGLMPYIESCDSLTIQLADNTPGNLMPKVGDKLVALEVNDKFEAGFAGVVKSVSGKTVVCDAVELGEVFETYYETTVMESRTENGQGARRRKAIDFNRDMTFDFPTYALNFGQEITANVIPLSSLALKGGIKLEASITPQVRIKASLIVNKKQGTNFSGSADFSASFKESVGLYGGLEKSKQFGLELYKVPIGRFIKFYFKPGIFMDKSVEASITNQWEQTCGLGFSFSFKEKAKDPLKFNIVNHEPTSTYDLIGCVDGRLAAGIFTEMGFAPNIPIFGTKLLNVALHSEFGAEIIGHAVLYNEEIKTATKETKTYEKLKASNIQVNSFVQHEVQKHLLTVDNIGPVASVSKTLAQWDFVPRFTSISADRKDDVVEVTLQVEKSKDNLLVPVDFGVALYNSSDEMVSKDYLGNYWKGSDGGTFTNFFTGLDRDEDYTVSPIVKIFDFELRASLTAEVETDAFPVRIISFVQTGSAYSAQQGFVYDGVGYYYKFNATTTVELSKKAKNVKDWGYIYHDFYGDDKKISCANLGSNPYADTRYAYYYNSRPYRTVKLSPYVQYEGESEIEEGDIQTYDVKYDGHYCPDDNHPHMIDLGLPSGTLWACCNVGASSPEQCGDYFAWGETNPKDDYSDDKYEYSYYDDYYYYHFVDIGRDIAGTANDAATANWGAPWRMPTLAQIQELLDNTYTDWTTQSGMNGRKFTAKNNGANIFLPAAGHRRWDETEYEYLGERGYYWSSILNDKEIDKAEAHFLYFYDYNAHSRLEESRYRGHSVRPVRMK